MNIVIVGAGKLGKLLTEQLVKESHDIIVVDTNSEIVNDLVNQYDIKGLCGNGASYEVQMSAEVAKADILIAGTSSDEVNILCCLVAKKIGVEQTIARIRNPAYSKQNAMMNSELGISMIVNPEYDTANEISRLLRFPSAIQVESFANGKVDLVEIRIEEKSPLIGKSLHFIREKYHVRVLVCAIKREDEVYIPNGNFILQEDDYVYLTSSSKEMVKFFKTLKILKEKIRTAIIIGGGRIAHYLVPNLIEYGIVVKVVDRDLKRCQELSEAIPKATVIHGEATDHRMLLEEGLESADSFVSLTGMDETNIIVSTYAKTLNCKKVITKVNNNNYGEILQSVGLESVISPKNITSDIIIRYVRGMESSKGCEFKTLYRLVDNQVEALEFFIPQKTEYTSIPIKELHFKSNSLLACIIRKNNVIIPTGIDMIEPLDTIIIITTSSGITDVTDILK